MIAKCPRCGKSVKWEGNDWRPFCSQRCKLVDLAAWIKEEYKIPGEELREEGSQKEERKMKHET